jgi:DNA-binding CsgD family transcriptional regulator
MKPEEFSRREGIKPLTVKANLEKIYKKLETV